MTKVKVTIEDQRLVIYKLYVSHNSKSNKGNLIKLHKKIKQNEKVCCAQNYRFPQSRSRTQSKVKDLLLTNSVTTITQKQLKGI